MTAIPLLAAAALAGCGGTDSTDATGARGPAPTDPAPADEPGDAAPAQAARAELRDPHGRPVGEVGFEDAGDRTRVAVEIEGLVADGGFHGFHVHANDDAANGRGCAASANAPAGTWFTSADGHLARHGEQHGHHQGDMPSLLVQPDGSAAATFVTDAFSVGDLAGTVVIVHAGPDNFANVPIGGAEDQYTPNAGAAVRATRSTGNAGDRIACGEVDVEVDD